MKMKTQPIWTYGTQKAVLRGKFIAMGAYIKNRSISINDIKLHVELLD
jgi:hypothetical protein